jgi:hypothetical protein
VVSYFRIICVEMIKITSGNALQRCGVDGTACGVVVVCKFITLFFSLYLSSSSSLYFFPFLSLFFHPKTIRRRWRRFHAWQVLYHGRLLFLSSDSGWCNLKQIKIQSIRRWRIWNKYTCLVYACVWVCISQCEQRPVPETIH